MKKAKKIKLYIGLFYFLFIGLFLYYFFSKFSIQEITSYDFIKNNRDYFFQLKETNLLLVATIFFLFIIFWVLAAGFGSPIAIFGGFIFGKWIGTIVVVLGLSTGATLLYVFANFFLKELIKEKFLKSYQTLEIKFKKSEFLYLLVYRFIGGIPFAISNVLPCIFNVKIFNFFVATLIGILPQIFLICSIGSGLEKIIEENLETPKILDLIMAPDIYIPFIIFVCLIIVTIFLRKLFYK
tara:strand:+ start:201 stop:917 length:717 start_codon:yes stop_codon:yes gene_type:complete